MVLANEMKCPVLSFDSDFFIYNLTHGYIPINYFDHDLYERENGECFMQARVYHIDNFLALFNSRLEHSSSEIRLRKELLPVFAVLSGNDYVDSFAVFGSFLQTLRAANNNCSRRTARQREVQFGRILEWLTQFGTVSECVDVLTRVCKADFSATIKRVVDESSQEYMLLRKSQLVKHIDIIRYSA